VARTTHPALLTHGLTNAEIVDQLALRRHQTILM
jgi:hypothetical protein